MPTPVTVGLIAHLVARPGKEEEVATFLAGALPLAQAEAFTPVWFAFRASKDQFYIVDAFPNADGPAQHLAGPIAAALMARADELFAVSPRIENLTVLGSKLPA